MANNFSQKKFLRRVGFPQKKLGTNFIKIYYDSISNSTPYLELVDLPGTITKINVVARQSISSDTTLSFFINEETEFATVTLVDAEISGSSVVTFSVETNKKVEAGDVVRVVSDGATNGNPKAFVTIEQELDAE